jgi:hypothetical protein
VADDTAHKRETRKHFFSRVPVGMQSTVRRKLRRKCARDIMSYVPRTTSILPLCPRSHSPRLVWSPHAFAIRVAFANGHAALHHAKARIAAPASRPCAHPKPLLAARWLASCLAQRISRIQATTTPRQTRRTLQTLRERVDGASEVYTASRLSVASMQSGGTRQVGQLDCGQNGHELASSMPS